MIQHLLAEDPWPLVGLFSLAALVQAIAMIATGRGRFLVGIVAMVVLSVLVLTTEWLWETDRERVDKTVDRLAKAVLNEDASSIVAFLSPRCRYGSLDPGGIERLAQSVFKEFDIQRVSLSNRRTQVFPLRQEATAEFVSMVRGKQGNTEFNPYPTHWLLTFTRDPEGEWKVLEIQQISAYGDVRQPMNLPSVPRVP